MKKIIFLLAIFFTTVLNLQAEEIKRITVGNNDAKITIIAYESLLPTVILFISSAYKLETLFKKNISKNIIFFISL